MIRLLASIMVLISSPVAACVGHTVSQDDASDSTFMGREDHPFTAPAPTEALATGLTIRDGELVVNLTLLAAPPRGDPFETYRYWLGFQVALEGREPEDIDFRVWATTQYDEAVLIGPNSAGNQRIGTYPLTWEGNTVTAAVPLAHLDEALGGTVQVGLPHGSTDGPSRSDSMQGYPFGAVFYDYYGDIFGDFVPLCRETPTPPAPLQADDPSNGTANTTSAPPLQGSAPAPTTQVPLGPLGALAVCLALALARRQT